MGSGMRTTIHGHRDDSAPPATVVRTERALNKRRVHQGLLLLPILLLYAVVLHWSYEVRISPSFEYLGSRYRDPNPSNYLAAFSMAYSVALFLPVRLHRPADLILWVLYVMACVPSILVPQYADILPVTESTKLGFFVASSFLLVVLLANKGPQLGKWRVYVPSHILWLSLAVVTVGIYGYMLYVTGLTFRFTSLTAVQDIRFAYRETILASGAGLGYLIGIQGNVINPVFIAKGLYERRWLPVVIGVIGQMLIFSVTGYKTVILSVPTLVLVAVMFWLSQLPLGRWILSGTLLASLIALVVDELQGALVYTQLFVNRLLLIPGTLTAAHVLVFQDLPKAKWGHSFLAPFVDYPYEATPSFIVGARFSGNAEVSANASFFADGYANLGYLGIFVEAFVLVLLLWVLNAASAHLSIAVSSMALLIPTVALANTSVFTSILTGGYLAAVVLLLLLPRRGWGVHGYEASSGGTEVPLATNKSLHHP